MEAPRRKQARKPHKKTVYDSLRLIHRSITEMQGLDRKQEELRIRVMIGLVDLIELMGFDEDTVPRIMPLKICKAGRII